MRSSTVRPSRGAVRFGIVVLLAATLFTSGALAAVAAGGQLSADGSAGPIDSVEPADVSERAAVGNPALSNASVRSSVTVTNGKATIEGWVRYENENGTLRPSPHTDVILRKRTIFPTNRKIDTTTTNESGYYSFEIDVAHWENGPGNTLKLKVQALAQNDAVNVVNFGKNQGTANGNTWTVENDGTINVGASSETFNFSISNEDERRSFAIANWTLEAYEAIENETDWTRKRVKARYPAAVDSNDKFKSPLEKFVIGSDDWNDPWPFDKRNTVHHEYGHATMSGLFKYKGWQAPHVSTWFGSHCIWSETGRIYAWYEGFAQFYESTVVDDPTIHGRPSDSIESYRFFNDNNLSNPDCPDSDTGDFDGKIVEGAVANILWDVADPANEPHDGINGSVGEVFDAVNETDNKAWGRIANNGRTRDIHDFFIQYVDNHPDRHEELRKIYFEYGINKPDRFEHDHSGSGSCTIHAYPCEKLDAEKWSPVTPNSSIDVGLHDRDDDYYRIENLQEEQLVTVNATVTDWAPSGPGDLRIVVSGSKSSGGNTVGPALGESTENIPHEERTFTVPEDGTYYVHVYDESSRHGGNMTYTLSVNATGQPPQTNEEDDTRAEATTLDPFRISDHVNTTEQSAATARHDHDFYGIELLKGERIYDASLRDGPGLEVAFEDDAGTELQRFANGESINTTTEPKGTYYFNVSGDARHSEYTLNVTTQRISQLYEDNDRKSAAADLEKDLGLETRTTRVTTGRGSTRCPSNNQNNPATGTPSTGTPGSQNTKCPRHNWRAGGFVSPGYAPNDADWYYVTARPDERINVTVPHEDLGVELYHDGTKIADAPARKGSSVSHYAQTSGKYYVNVTGDDYVAVHDLYVWRFHKQGADDLEPNDEQSTAERVTTATSGNHTESYDLLKLAGSDEDYFAVDLDEDDGLNATLTHLESAGDVSLTVVKPDGTTVDGTDPQAATFGSKQKIKQVTLTAKQSGTYYVRVSGSARTALKYNLTITTNSTSTVDWSSPLLNHPVIDMDPITVEVDPVDPPEWAIEQLEVGPGSAECTLHDAETRSRQISISGGTSTKVQKSRTFDLDYPSPCKVVAHVTGPDRAEVDVYVTVDGSDPTTNDYQLTSQTPGSDESLVIERDDGLARNVPIKVMVEGYPVAGDYEVVVEKFSDSP